MRNAGRLIFLLSGLLIPSLARAHGFGALYNLPVPLWLYNWSASAILIVSFLMAAFLVTSPPPARPMTRDITNWALCRWLRKLMPVFRLLSVFVLLLCIATGFWGNQDPMRNFSPVFFWVIFTLVLTYTVVLTGDIYAALNPFRELTNGLGRLGLGGQSARIKYPVHWGCWPAVFFYLLFIWFELFGTGTPFSIAVFLSGYTVLNILGVFLIGARDWFRYCEFFSVFFRLVALLAPVDYQRAEPGLPGHLRLRLPLSGLLHDKPGHISTVAFVLAMLSTTAFDGMKATKWWVELFWGDPTGWIENFVGTQPAYAISSVMPWYIAWGTFWLMISPFLYLFVFLAVLWVAKRLTGTERSVQMLALDFAYTLLPIALMYHITHYWTLILSHGLKVFSAISDPFGWRWDLLGTAHKFRAPIIPDMGVVWHSQVVLIIVGHIASVWLAHKVALKVFPSRVSGTLSQLPILVLMILFTVFGLWILAQPLTVTLMG